MKLDEPLQAVEHLLLRSSNASDVRHIVCDDGSEHGTKQHGGPGGKNRKQAFHAGPAVGAVKVSFSIIDQASLRTAEGRQLKRGSTVGVWKTIVDRPHGTGPWLSQQRRYVEIPTSS